MDDVPEGAIPFPEGATPIYDEDGSSGMADVIESLHEQVYSMAREGGNGPKNFREDVEGGIVS